MGVNFREWKTTDEIAPGRSCGQVEIDDYVRAYAAGWANATLVAEHSVEGIIGVLGTRRHSVQRDEIFDLSESIPPVLSLDYTWIWQAYQVESDLLLRMFTYLATRFAALGDWNDLGGLGVVHDEVELLKQLGQRIYLSRTQPLPEFGFYVTPGQAKTLFTPLLS